MIPTIVFDLDGTIADHSYRIMDGWVTRTGIINDPIILAPTIVYKTFEPYYNMVIVTARGDAVRKDTEEWLDKNGFKYSDLFMRKEDDKRPDYLVKYDIYKEEMEGIFDILFVMDDNNRVCKVWRDAGLTCFQVQESEY